MSGVQKALLGLVLQAGLTICGIYVGVSESALPGSSSTARLAIAVLFVGVALLFGEVQRVRRDMALLLSALKAQAGGAAAKDQRLAVDVLVSALESPEARVREVAHKNLVRITRQDLPLDAARWRDWWSGARAAFPVEGHPEAAAGGSTLVGREDPR
jgi:hypothetical protein